MPLARIYLVVATCLVQRFPKDIDDMFAVGRDGGIGRSAVGGQPFNLHHLRRLIGALALAMQSLNISLAFQSRPEDQALTNQPIAEAVIAMTKAEWAADIRDPSSVAEQSKDLAEDYTEFRPEYPTRLEGKDVYMRINAARATGSSKTISSEMFNPKVQVYNGDVAVLSYQYVGMDKDKDGKTETTRVKVTRVYVKKDGKWMLVHKNVGSDPLPK